jgi:hypothetical protein
MTDRPPANPTDVYALVWAGDISRESIALASRRRTAETGFDLPELSLHDLDRLDVTQARDTLERCGLQVACSHVIVFDADVSSEDSAVVPGTVLRQWLTQRWRGYDLSPDEIADKGRGQRLSNGRLEVSGSVDAKFFLRVIKTKSLRQPNRVNKERRDVYL